MIDFLIVAVRRVVDNVLSARDVQPSKAKSSASRCRSSRLENKVGLNVTKVEYIANKMKEREQRENRSGKSRLSKQKTDKVSTNKMTKRYRKTTSRCKNNQENDDLIDLQIAKAI